VARGPRRDIFERRLRPMDAAGPRLHNERAVMTAVARAPGQSAAEVARATGLGAQSVARILVELEQVGLVVRGEPIKGRRGQPAVPIYPNPDGAFILGCEIGWRHFHILIRNFTGKILGEHRRDYAFPDADAVFGGIGAEARLLVDLVPADLQHRVLGMGLAMPSGIGRNIDLVGGSVAQAQRWKALDITAAAEAASGLQIFRYNDGNAACWAELAAHPPPRPANLAYFQVGTFTGAGLVAEGRLWEGPTGNSANLGSMVVTQPDGRQQFVHLIASIYAFEARLRTAGLEVPAGNPIDWDWTRLEPVTEGWLQDSADALAKAIVNAHAVMEFSVALVDGVMPRPVVARLVDKVQREVDAMPVLTADPPKVEMGRLGGAAAARGAALKPLWRRYFSLDPDDLQRISPIGASTK
jgi:predicted NBD/HSP70 family sugar kinase